MSNENKNGFVDQLGRGLGGLFKFIIRLTFVLLLAVALGAGLYYGIAYGIPAFDRAYLQPVRDNTAAIAVLENQANTLTDQNSEQIAALQERLTLLEVQNDTNLNTIDALQTQFNDLTPLITELETLREQQAVFDETLSALNESAAAALAENAIAFSALQEMVNGHQEAITSITADLASNDFPIDQAYADLQLVKAMSLLTRAQVFIYQDNYGLAAADVEAARTLLIAIDGDPALEGLDLTAVLNRLSLALGGLPQTPDLASADLSVAWDLLVEGIMIQDVEPALPEPAVPEPVETEETPL